VSLAQSGMEICKQKHSQNSAGEIYKSQATDYSISHFEINIDTIDFATQQLYGRTKVTFVANPNSFSSATLDLLGFTIDNILPIGSAVTYNYNDTVINMQFS